MREEELDWLQSGPADAPVQIVLAHGAGAPMDSDFMARIASHMAEQGLRVLRFEFPYMRKRREDGRKRPPDREPILLEAWREAVRQVRDQRPLVIGGKSLGGRMASLVADELQADGLVCLGYPFHPSGKPDRLRVEHLRNLCTPTLILQGERDPFGRRAEVERYDLASTVRIAYVPDGDHSFQPRKSAEVSEADNLSRAAAVAADFAFTVAQ